MHVWFSHGVYGKILSSILKIYMTSRPACDCVYISLVPTQALGYNASFSCIVYEYLYTDELVRWSSGLLSFDFLMLGVCMCMCVCVHE